MKRTATRLADGRELIYFDRRDDVDRSAADERPLPPRPAPSQLRHDPLLDEWVAIAAHRQDRTFLPSTDDCPLCPSSPGHLTEVPSPDYEVVVFENRFPSYGPAGPDMPGGRCEVVCFSSDHNASFASLPPAQVQTVLEAWADRTRELSALPGVEQVFCFENRGEAIGVTLSHPHGQIYAYPFVAPRTRQMLDVARRYAGDLFADVLAAERKQGERVVASNDLWTAFVPRAPRYPYELHVFPHRPLPDLTGLDQEERAAFGELYLDVLGRLDRLFGFPLPYVSAWHQAPVNRDRDLAWLHLELFSIQRAPGKLKFLAGSESAMGAFVNDVSPEQAAERLRNA